MTDLWTYNDPALVADTDLIGYDVQATDGGIGEIGEATYESGSSRIVVETGFWIFGKKRMIPAGAITKVDNDAREVHLAMTKDEVKDAPDWQPDRWPDDDYRSTHRTYYEEFRGPR